MDDPALDAALASTGPLSPSIARALIDRGRERLDAGEPADGARHFSRVVGNADPTLTAAAWLGLGDAQFRVDRDDEALASWRAVTRMPETPSTYKAWRQVAAALVRSGDLPGATKAYREAERRSPPEDRAEIASRLGWLLKEQGNSGAARRYFARSRGSAPVGVALVVLGVTIAVSILATLSPESGIYEALWLDRFDVLRGELYRLLTVTLLHDGPIHLLFNMYALYLLGPIVEQIWGSRLFAAFYLLTALAASTASINFSPGPAVGASGAIFGLVGVLLAGTRVHHPVLDQRARSIVPQLGMVVLINLVFGFAAGGGAIDNAAHIGGLISGLWLGLVVPPGRVPTLRSFWQQPAGQAATTPPVVILAGVLVLIAAILVGLSLAGVRL
jgi:membrane associated rhomboid family serine protease